MICPKCQNMMRTVDRQGVHIDQCDGCRGIFLDRGELESVLAAEQRYGLAAPPPYRDSPRGYQDSPRGYPDSPRGYRGGHGRRRKSFLEDLFD